MSAMDFYRVEFERHLRIFPLMAPNPSLKLGAVMERMDSGFYHVAGHVTEFGVDEDIEEAEPPEVKGANITFASDEVKSKRREGAVVLQYAQTLGLNVDANFSFSVASEEGRGVYCEMQQLTEHTTAHFSAIRKAAKKIYRHPNWDDRFAIATRIFQADGFSLVGASSTAASLDLFSKISGNATGSPLSIALTGTVVSRSESNMSLLYEREDGIVGVLLTRIRKRFLRSPSPSPVAPGVRGLMARREPADYELIAEEFAPGVDLED